MNAEERDVLIDHLAKAIEHPSQRYFFYVSLREEELIVPGTAHESDNDEDGPTLHLQYIDVEGEVVLPVFSSREKFHEMYGQYGKPYIAIPGWMLLEAADDSFAWLLNPGFVPCKKIIAEELKSLKDSSIYFMYFNQLEEDEKKAYISERMTEFNEQLREQYISCLREFPEISEAYFANVFHPGVQEQTLPVLILKVEPSNEEQAEVLIRNVHENIQHAVEDGPQIGVLLYDEALPLVNSIVSYSEPFYEQGQQQDWASLFR